MTGKRELKREKDFLINLRTIMETYEEIAATRMTRVRTSVLQNRNFLLGLNSIFKQVRFSYEETYETEKNCRSVQAYLYET
jgi:F0F1-type ATP synthase gamma subunit